MNIKEIKKAKEDLEMELQQLIYNFETETGLTIQSVDILRTYREGYYCHTNPIWQVETKIEI